MPSSLKILSVQIFLPEECKGRAARRLLLNSGVLKSAKIVAGDLVILSSTPLSDFGSSVTPYAICEAWPSMDLPSTDIAVSLSVLLTAQLKEGSTAFLAPLSESTLPFPISTSQRSCIAEALRLCEIDSSGSPTSAPAKISKAGKGKSRDWLSLLIRETLVDHKYVTPSQIIAIEFEGRSRCFSVISVSIRILNGDKIPELLSQDMSNLRVHALPSLCLIDWDTTVSIEDPAKFATQKWHHKSAVEALAPNSTADAYSSVGGLTQQIELVRDLIDIPLMRPALFRHFGLKPPRGILLHGPPGTGKTHLARAIASSTGSSVIIVNGPELTSAYHGETEASLRRVFADARERSPCVLVLDEVDAICPRREDGAGGEVEKRTVATLLTEMDGIEAEGDVRVVVVATTNRPNAIDPALRRPGRFDREIEIGVPDVEARISILGVLLKKTPNSLTSEDLRAVASRAHGYVGADLAAVVREAGTLAIKRHLALSNTTGVAAVPGALTVSDLEAALPSIRPSMLRAHLLDAAPVRFSDIGGLDSTIARLRECVEWPLVHAQALARLGVRAPRGVLLCGPPGCSKTVLVRAIATETGVNFVAVRGPELVNKYVGESERAVREVFRKARAAAPSIIFFDEIDALAAARSNGTESGSHTGVLISLLNEMDGIEELNGVTVIGATNRPDVLDSALMRPGRFDRTLYVGPPDHAGRVEILKIRTRKMSVDPELDVHAIAELTDGCSGAEISALCQEAALLAMQANIEAPYVPQSAFLEAARRVKRQITPEMLRKFERWSAQS
ncbi:AAA family ATPase [Vararia minispora EC-137]|uniref:AAA family ATPase n=1 Tax=Vararia minispora EC-137 TaxID=1314806 RepID=A0ACB8QAS5_9AGAM|nr:AAA family ATPase [Vararia minispora EC-137]